MEVSSQQLRTGLLLAVIANLIWGLAALFWSETALVSPVDVVAHRAVWSLPVALLALLWAGRLRTTLSLLRVPRILLWSALGTLLLALNWGVFVYAVFAGRATDASLGYFMLPLLTVLVGKLAFDEVLGAAQTDCDLSGDFGCCHSADCSRQFAVDFAGRIDQLRFVRRH